MKQSSGINQSYRVLPGEQKSAAAVDAGKDAMSDSDYGDALKRALAAE